MTDAVDDLLAFIDSAPTPYHAVREAVGRLARHGYRPLREDEAWSLDPGDRRTLVRGDGSLVALCVGSQPPAEAGFRVIGAHTDSPNLRLKPRPDHEGHGYRRLGVEPYGGVLLHTWLDRDLSLAGRVSYRGERGVETTLVDFRRPLLRIPNLAIHLNREVGKEGLKLNPQQHGVPVVGLDSAATLAELVTEEIRAHDGPALAPDDLLAFELMTYDLQPSARGGADDAFVFAPRLDNLASCHAALCALLAEEEQELPAATRMIVLYDHEEVGSRSAQGAGGTLLADTLARTVDAVKGGAPQGVPRAIARSLLVSADMAHAVHPNYSDRHEPAHQPRIGAGPVIKVNANQAYASDAESAAVFAAACRDAGVVPQHFVSRSDLACGSTIGPISAARVGIRTVDVGNPMLSMHSCREMAGSADVEPMIRVLTGFLRTP